MEYNFKTNPGTLKVSKQLKVKEEIIQMEIEHDYKMVYLANYKG